MPFRVRTEDRANAFAKNPTVLVLEGRGGNRLDVWPSLGFNAFRWTAHGTDILFRDPGFFEEMRPSRSGIPVLFPFPNRIRDGRFSSENKEYHLPKNESTGAHAIHGFAMNAAWHLLAPKLSAHEGQLSAVYKGPAVVDGRELWPADSNLTVIYRLGLGYLEVVARVRNGSQPLPMGVGFHPYFRLEPFGGSDALVWVAAQKFWELKDNLPTGRVLPVDEDRDLRRPTPLGDRKLDDVYTDLESTTDEDSMRWVAGIKDPSGARRLEIGVSPQFRELVAFTPPHRRALCLEPYSCTTDAVNLQAKGINAGWLVLPPEQTWEATFRMEYHVSGG